MSCQADHLAALLQSVADGDRRAFRALYDAAGGRLLAIALRILRDPQAADDAVQEAFLRIWRNAARYAPAKGAPMAWMGVVARNAALDLVRARRPMQDLEDVEPLDLAVAATEPPDARLAHCIGRLPENQARAIVTMYTYGLSHSELAEHLAVPLGTAKSWVKRGTDALRECMTS